MPVDECFLLAVAVALGHLIAGHLIAWTIPRIRGNIGWTFDRLTETMDNWSHGASLTVLLRKLIDSLIKYAGYRWEDRIDYHMIKFIGLTVRFDWIIEMERYKVFLYKWIESFKECEKKLGQIWWKSSLDILTGCILDLNV